MWPHPMTATRDIMGGAARSRMWRAMPMGVTSTATSSGTSSGTMVHSEAGQAKRCCMAPGTGGRPSMRPFWQRWCFPSTQLSHRRHGETGLATTRLPMKPVSTPRPVPTTRATNSDAGMWGFRKPSSIVGPLRKRMASSPASPTRIGSRRSSWASASRRAGMSRTTTVSFLTR